MATESKPKTAAARTSNPFAPGESMGPFGVGSLGVFPTNPFAASPAPFAAVVDVNPDVPPPAYTYTMLPSGPEVSAEEVEDAHASAIEVLTVWDSNVLHVDHLTPPRSYFVGEEIGDEKGTCDFFLPSEMLGATRAPVVVTNGGTTSLVILPRSNGTFEVPGQVTVTLADLIVSGRARPSASWRGMHEIELPPGAKARMELEHSGLAFVVNAVHAGRHEPTGFFSRLDAAAYAYFALSLVLHLGIVTSLAFFMPHMAADDAEALDRDALLMMQHMLNAAAEREEEKTETADVPVPTPEGGAGAQAAGPSGTMGTPTTHQTDGRFAVKGPPENAERHLAREDVKREAGEFGLIGLLNTGLGGDPRAPTSPWGQDDALGSDAVSARGTMWGATIGDAAGVGGLGLSGVGELGGGDATGIGLSRVGTVGQGGPDGDLGGFGHGHGRPGGVYTPHTPRMTIGDTKVNGHIPREVIQRIVRQNFGRFTLCYKDGLRTNPNLAGRVVVKFVIDHSGGVMLSQDGGSDMRDSAVVACVVRSFGALSFPAPEGGIVTVEYPIVLSPSGD